MNLLTKAKVFAHNSYTKGRVLMDENGPKAAIYGGTALLVGAIVLTAKQSLKADEVLEAAKSREERINTALTSPEISEAEYSAEDAKLDIRRSQIQTVKDFVVLYRAPIVMAVTGVVGILWGTNKLDKKVRDLTIGLAAIQQALTEYRKRVSDAVGEETEKNLYLGTKVTKVDVLDENGNPIMKAEQVIKETDTEALKHHPNIIEFGTQTWYGSMNAVFDPHAPSSNILTVINALKNAQRNLELYGEAWVRDILKDLGIKKCPTSLLNHGWKVKRDSEGKLYAPVGDAKIDFGLITDSKGNVCLDYYCDTYDLNEEEVGIASALPIMLMFNSCDIVKAVYLEECERTTKLKTA